jgi:hypothetical protein
MDDVIQSAWFEAIGRTNILGDPEAQKRFEICTHKVLYDRKIVGDRDLRGARGHDFACREKQTQTAAWLVT